MNVKVLCLGVTTTMVAIAGLALCAPNILWLRHSTIRIANLGQSAIPQTTLRVGDQALNYHSIEPGDAEFALLPRQGEGSVVVTLPPSHNLDSFCHTYIESTMYHIDVTVEDGKVIACDASLPILSSLWVFKALL